MINLLKVKGFNPQKPEEVLYYPQWTRVATTNQRTLGQRIARGGTFSVGEATGLMIDFPQYIFDELLAGNAVSIEGLGTFKLKVSGRSNPDKAKVTSAGCKINVTFSPDSALEARLNSEAEFRFVTKPTDDGEQDAEGETPAPTPDGGSDGGSDDNENSMEP